MLGRNGNFLREVAEAEILEGDFAVVELLLAEDDTEEGGFASAIDADDANLVASFESKITVIVDDFGAVSKLEMGGFHVLYYNILLKQIEVDGEPLEDGAGDAKEMKNTVDVFFAGADTVENGADGIGYAAEEEQ